MAYKVGMVSLGCEKPDGRGADAGPPAGRRGWRSRRTRFGDVVIVNTCGFIEDAKKEAIENILELAQLKKEGRIRKIIVTGCLARRGTRRSWRRSCRKCDGVLGLEPTAIL